MGDKKTPVDYSWPTVEDYEECVGFKVNQAFRMGWEMARTTDTMLGFKDAEEEHARPDA